MNGLVCSGCGRIPLWLGWLGVDLTQASMGPPLGKAQLETKRLNRTRTGVMAISFCFSSGCVVRMLAGARLSFARPAPALYLKGLLGAALRVRSLHHHLSPTRKKNKLTVLPIREISIGRVGWKGHASSGERQGRYRVCPFNQNGKLLAPT